MIETCSKWVPKNGDMTEVEIIDRREHMYEYKLSYEFVDCIWYRNSSHEVLVETEADFLRNYTIYEPVYEYQYAYKRKEDVYWSIDMRYSIACPFLANDKIEYQRLDFTKRERK